MIFRYFITTMIALAAAFPVLADSYHHERSPDHLYGYSDAPHAGQMDTDGILSPGEIRNPNIDYDRAQRHAEHHDDPRVDNPYNDDAARDEREREAREREWRERREEERERDRSWWNW